MTTPFPLVTYISPRRRDLLKRRRTAYAAISSDLYLLTTATPPRALSDFRGAKLFPLTRGRTVVTAVASDPCAVRIDFADRPALTVVCDTLSSASRLAAAIAAATISLSDLRSAVLERRRANPGLRGVLDSLRPRADAAIASEDEPKLDMDAVLSSLTAVSAAVKGTAAAFEHAGEWASALADTMSTTQITIHIFERVFGALPIAAPIFQVVGLAADVAALAVERSGREAEMHALSSRCSAITRDIVSGLFFSMDYVGVEDAAVDNLFAVMHKVCDAAHEAEQYVMKGRGMQMLTIDQVSTLSAQVAEIETLVTSLRILQYVQENHARNQRVDECVKDVYRKSLLVTPSAVSSVMLFDCVDTPEARLREKLFDEACTSGLVGAVGMSGVGKTSILTAIANEPSIRRYFDGGIYEMRLGAGSLSGSVISGLAGVVERSGGLSAADKIRAIEDLDDAILAAKDWFFSHRCLFILDDAQEAAESSTGFVRELRNIVDLTVGSRALFSTYSRTLAYSAANRQDVVEVEPRNMTVATQILCKYADIDFSEVEKVRQSSPSSEDLKALDILVESCGGLPVCLAVVGNAIAQNPRNNSKNQFEVCRALLDKQGESGRLHREALVATTLESYAGFVKSINAIWEGLEQSDLRVGGFHASELRQMNNGLCVCQSDIWTDASVLKRLWGIELDQVHSIILALESFNLSKTRHVENKMEVRIHRLMLEYCTNCAAKNLEMPPRAWHNQLLASYMGTSETGYRPWWTCADLWDGYIRANLVRHLLHVEAYEELRALLLDFRWIKCCVDAAQGNLFAALDLLEKDYRMALPGASLGQSVMVSGRTALHELNVSLSLIAESLRLSRGSLVRQPGEASFQITGRLISAKNRPDIQEFLRSVKVHADTPTVWSIRPSLTSVGGPLVQAIDVGWSIYALVVIPKSSRVLLGGKGGAAIVDLHRGSLERVLRESCDQRHAVVSVATTKHGTHAVCGWTNGTVNVWELGKTNAKMLSFKVGTGDVYVAVTTDGKHIVTGDEDGNIGAWDLATGAMVGELNKVHRRKVSCLGVKPEEDVIMTGSYDYTVCSSEIFSKTSVEIAKSAVLEHVTCAAWTRCGEKVVVGWEFAGVSVYRNCGGKDGEDLKGVAYSAVSLKISDDDELVACGCMNGNVYVCDLRSRELAFEPLVGHTGTVSAVSFDSKGEQIVSGSHDGSVRTWRLQAAPSRHPGHSGAVRSIASSPKGDMIASGSNDETVCVWNMESGEKVLGPLKAAGGRGVMSIAFSRDGTLLACGYKRGVVWVWDLQSGDAVLERLEGHRGAVRCVAFSADGRMLVSGGEDQKVCVWDGTTGNALYELSGHTNWVSSVCFDGSGERIASGSYDKTMRIWEVANGRCVGAALQVRDRAMTLAFTAGGTQLQGLLAFSKAVERFSVEDGTRVAGGQEKPAVNPTLRSERREICDMEGTTIAMLDHAVSAGPVIDEQRSRVWAGLETGMVACVELHH